MKKHKIVYILRILGILFIAYGLGLAIAGKSAGMSPAWLLLGVLCAALSLKKPFAFVRSKKWLKALLLAAAALVIVLEGAVAAVGWGSAPASACDVIIVLGAKVDGEIPSRTLMYRLDAAYKYLSAHPETKAVLSGGRGADEEITEAEAMCRYLTAKGIEKGRLILEDRSTSTYENLINSFGLLGSTAKLKIAVVTSDFHVLRARLIALKLGRHVGGIGSKTEWSLAPNYYLRELLGIAHDLLLV
jgi:uncharacterized SAM-binding protein YcdF (DUF218 family)